MMIGKINLFNFKSLFILNTFALIVTSYIFSNYIFIAIFILFFLISSLATKHGLKIITQLRLFQNIRNIGPAIHFNKKYTPTTGGIFIIIPFLILLLILSINFYTIKILLLFFCVFGLYEYFFYYNKLGTIIYSQNETRSLFLWSSG